MAQYSASSAGKAIRKITIGPYGVVSSSIYCHFVPSTEPVAVRSTAALDGLRGTVAFLVMGYHYFANWSDSSQRHEPDIW